MALLVLLAAAARAGVVAAHARDFTHGHAGCGCNATSSARLTARGASSAPDTAASPGASPWGSGWITFVDADGDHVADISDGLEVAAVLLRPDGHVAWGRR